MVLGIALSIIASVLFGISIVLQKCGLRGIKKFSFKSFLGNKMWASGVAIGILGILAYLAALSVADLSTVQPVTALTLIIPVVSGVFLFKEKVGKFEWSLLCLVAIGIILVSLS